MSFAKTRRARRVLRRGRALSILQKDVNVLKKNIDVKFFDQLITDAVVSATGLVQAQQYTIPDGNAQSEKDGLLIVIKSIQYRFQLKIPSTVTVADSTDICRFILVKDKQANGALPAVLDILNATDITAYKNLNNKGRFVTLFDKTVSISSMGAFGDGTTNATLPNTKSWQFFKKVNIPIVYNNSATTGAIATINSNNLVLLLISEAGKCGVNYKIRIRYTD